MAKINLLEKSIYNRISAGEVVENPASVVKELVENSIDAGATFVTIEIKDGGTKSIVISDDGCGIDKEDIELAFTPHATSKIRTSEDLDAIETLGFRGEALASIAAVAHVEMVTRTENDEMATKINIEGGEVVCLEEAASNKGTRITVNQLFFNTPARRKFLRKNKTEESEVTHLVERLMLVNKEIKIKYVVDGKVIYNTTTDSLVDKIYTIYGRHTALNLIKIDFQRSKYHITGFIGHPNISKANRTYQTLIVNGRLVQNHLVSSSISQAYDGYLMKGKFPFYVLYLSIPSDSVDVNVHPTKQEIKFDNNNEIFSIFHAAVTEALSRVNYVNEINTGEGDEDDVVLENHGVDVPTKDDDPNGLDAYFKQVNKATKTGNFDEVVAPKTVLRVNFPNGFEGFENRKEPLMSKFAREMNNIPEEYKAQDIKNIQRRIEEDFQLKKNGIELEEINCIPARQENFGELEYGEVDVNADDDEIYFKKNQVQDSILNDTDSIKIIGTVFNTYIMAELDNDVYLVDQHAFHERRLYDKLISEMENKDVAIQDLLVPYEFDCNAIESNFFIENQQLFEDVGFYIEQTGDRTFQITKVPFLVIDVNIPQFIEDVRSNTTIFTTTTTDLIKNNIAQTACKHAIKAGDILTKEEMKGIIDDVKNQKILLCPHGRPIVVKVAKTEIEKWFKRIV